MVLMLRTHCSPVPMVRALTSMMLRPHTLTRQRFRPKARGLYRTVQARWPPCIALSQLRVWSDSVSLVAAFQVSH